MYWQYTILIRLSHIMSISIGWLGGKRLRAGRKSNVSERLFAFLRVGKFSRLFLQLQIYLIFRPSLVANGSAIWSGRPKEV